MNGLYHTLYLEEACVEATRRAEQNGQPYWVEHVRTEYVVTPRQPKVFEFSSELEEGCQHEADQLIKELGLVAQFTHKIRSRQLGLAEARDDLYRGLVEELDCDDKFAWVVVDKVTKLSGAEGFCYDW